jgi:hypothetical protein
MDNQHDQRAAEKAARAEYLASLGYQFNPETGTWQLKPKEPRPPSIPPAASRKFLNQPDEDYTYAVCLLLPKGYATLIDVVMFEFTERFAWKVMGRTIFFTEYSPVSHTRRRCGIGRTGYGTFRRPAKSTFHSFHREVFLRGITDHEERQKACLELKEKDIDHRNRVPWDNRLGNLRLATKSENGHNKAKGKRGSSQYKGVSKVKGRNRWTAQVRLKGKRHYLGTFDDEFKAAQAYNAFVRKHIPDFGYINPLAIRGER